ncbi:MAG: phenylalanine--tRNA ligase subunit beta [Oligoflexia bacterium]|nr:phenylalanine--tRNA ligase subunit beta [Oligoflexia bacterium]MBF0366365.1 phenylalanine--tRNA ligase subunit beta [Oligoflexia bacterium]
MLISYDWIKDFVELKHAISERDFMNDVTLSTCEVEGVETSGSHWPKIRVAKVVAMRKHPEAEKLNLVSFSFNADFSPAGEVVCGAPNVRVGMKVPHAPIGVTLPNGITLEAKKIRGVLSEGMLCSAAELGISSEASGLLELAEDAPLGESLEQYFGERHDMILNIDNKSITHRPDLWGHYGMAREIATIYRAKGAKFHTERFDQKWEENILSSIKNSHASPLRPVLEGESAGLAYYALSVDNIKVAPSPRWLARRLSSVGLRPINNMVDIGNYVMLELGIPLHIFDRSQLHGDKIIIKRTGRECVLRTLDEVERTLTATDTVVADCKRPLVIAGIMGGAESGVNENTTQILIEVANWKAHEVRKTSSRLGLRSDSSQRYEKSLDSKMLKRTLLRAYELVKELCTEAHAIGSIESDAAPGELDAPPLTIDTSYQEICNYLGKTVPKEEIDLILRSLDFNVSNPSNSDPQKLHIVVPSVRATKDIECMACIAEEIGRMIGYNSITPISPLAPIKPVRLSPAKTLHRKVQDFMVQHGGALEVYTYPLIGEKLLQSAGFPAQSEELVLLNALSREADRMRPSLIPSMLATTALNQKSYESFKFFEMGRVFPAGTNFSERNHLGVAFFHREQVLFSDLLNTIENLFKSVKVKCDFLLDYQKSPKLQNSSMFIPEAWIGKHPHQFYNLLVQGSIVGAIMSVAPMALRNFKIRGELVLAVVDLSAFQDRESKEKMLFKPLPKFPSANFDCTVVAPGNKPVEEIIKIVKESKIKELSEVKVLTLFSLANGDKAVTLRSVFYNPEKTLSGEEIKAGEEKIVSELSKAGLPLKA